MDVQNQILSYLIDDAIKKLRQKHRSTDAFMSLKNALRQQEQKTTIEWHELFRQCHELYGLLGGILTADHWQSPSFDGSKISEVGDEQGKIIENLNDYKRDQHPVGLVYEQAYAMAFLQHSFVTTPTAFATTSGMAALTVAALVVRQRLPKQYRIAVGEHSYFENHELLRMIFPEDCIVPFDEQSPETLRKIQPHAIFFDLIANDPSMTVADISGIFSVAGLVGRHVDVVVDTTCASMAHFRIPIRMRLTGNVSILGFESLNKYHQFGLDRVTGGILWAYGVLDDTLYRVRDHAGVIIPEIAAAALPMPHRALHEKYLRRLEQNALCVARLLDLLQNIRVRYPGLSTHPGFRLAKRIGYSGSFVSIEFPGRSWQTYQKALQSILKEAKKRHVPMIAGSTFGTPVTRIYTWSPRSKFEKSFLRISPGLESSEEIAGVCDVLIHALA